MKSPVLDIGTENDADRPVIREPPFFSAARVPAKRDADGVFTRDHMDGDRERNVLSLAGGDMVPPAGPVLFLHEKGVEAIEPDLVGKSLIDDPGAAPGEHDPPVLGIHGIEIAGQQGVVAARELSPGCVGPEHAAAAVGPEKQDRPGEKLAAPEHLPDPGVVGPGKKQQRGFAPDRARAFIYRHDERPRPVAAGCGRGGKEGKPRGTAFNCLTGKAFLLGQDLFAVGHPGAERRRRRDQKEVIRRDHHRPPEIFGPPPGDHPGVVSVGVHAPAESCGIGFQPLGRFVKIETAQISGAVVTSVDIQNLGAQTLRPDAVGDDARVLHPHAGRLFAQAENLSRQKRMHLGRIFGPDRHRLSGQQIPKFVSHPFLPFPGQGKMAFIVEIDQNDQA